MAADLHYPPILCICAHTTTHYL